MNVTLSLFAGAGAQFLDNNGNILSGGLIYTYGAGTTTPLATYTSNLGTDSHPNPIVLDSAGRIPGGEIWLLNGLGYKFVTKDSNNVLIGTYDNVPSSAQPPIINDASSIAYEQGNSTNAGSFIIGDTYLITSVGSTNFQLIGAVSNTVGTHFIATGAGSGSGTAQLSQTVQTKLQEYVSVKDFGAKGDGFTDDTAAIQSCINYVQGLTHRPTILFPVGTYITSSTLTISKDCIALEGMGNPATGASSTGGGVTIRYHGTGTALYMGIPFNTAYTFLNSLSLRNLRFELDDTTTVGVWIYQPANSTFENLAIFGNSVAGSIGLRVDAGINNIFKQIDIVGSGQNGTGGTNTIGGYFTLGYANQPMTTTTLYSCYFHYCNYGVKSSYVQKYVDCIFEANQYGINILADAYCYFYRCWWEANTILDVVAANNHINMQSCNINAYSRQVFFNESGGGCYDWIISESTFTTTNAAPFLFQTAPNGTNIFNPVPLSNGNRLVLCRNQYPKNFQIGYIYTNSTVNLIQLEEMRKQTYTFTALALAASASVSAMPTITTLTQYTMPEQGHLISLNIYTSVPITAGSYNFNVKINGTSVSLLGYPSIPSQTTTPVQFRLAPFQVKFAKNDVLTIALSADSSWAPTNDVVIEVVAYHGPDGELI